MTTQEDVLKAIGKAFEELNLQLKIEKEGKAKLAVELQQEKVNVSKLQQEVNEIRKWRDQLMKMVPKS